MHIDAICETNGKGWLIWAAQCPGAFARGATENEALAKLPGDGREPHGPPPAAAGRDV